VVVISRATFDSPHVLREVERAVSERRRIVSLRREPVELTGSWEYLLGAVQWIDSFDRPAVDGGRELVGSLKATGPVWMPRPSVVWLGLAVPILMLFLALFLTLQPPRLEPLVIALFSLAALAAPALGARLFMPQLAAPHWLKPSLLVSLGCPLVYTSWWSNFIYEAQPRHADDSKIRPIPKVIGGFLPLDGVDQLMSGPDREVGLTYQKVLKNASFDPEQVWRESSAYGFRWHEKTARCQVTEGANDTREFLSLSGCLLPLWTFGNSQNSGFIEGRSAISQPHSLSRRR
jgi:hypothetical protein